MMIIFAAVSRVLLLILILVVRMILSVGVVCRSWTTPAVSRVALGWWQLSLIVILRIVAAT